MEIFFKNRQVEKSFRDFIDLSNDVYSSDFSTFEAFRYIDAFLRNR